MRATIVGLALLALSSSSAAAAPAAPRVAYLHDGDVVVVDPATGRHRVVLRRAGTGPVAWSGDGRLLSSGGRVVGGPSLPAAALQWAPEGQTAAYMTAGGAVETWSRKDGRRRVVPGGWGATSLAWGQGGRIALGRWLCSVPCTAPMKQEVWIWKTGTLRRVTGPLPGVSRPIVAGIDPTGRALWWPQKSASVAADGLVLFANRTPLVSTLLYPDYVVRCGRRLALVAGGDRYATHGKRIVVDARDVSRDSSRSWVSPSCDAVGRTIVAAAGRNWEEREFGLEHRAIWQLLPVRRQLTRPPPGWTDEAPHVLPDGSILFVRSRLLIRGGGKHWSVTTRGKLSRLAGGKVRTLADLTYAASGANPVDVINYYGHYGWPELIAASR